MDTDQYNSNHHNLTSSLSNQSSLPGLALFTSSSGPNQKAIPGGVNNNNNNSHFNPHSQSPLVGLSVNNSHLISSNFGNSPGSKRRFNQNLNNQNNLKIPLHSSISANYDWLGTSTANLSPPLQTPNSDTSDLLKLSSASSQLSPLTQQLSTPVTDVASSSNMTSPNSSLNCSSGSLAKSLGSGRRFRSAVKLIINEKRATSHYKAKYTYNGADLVAHVAEFSQRLATTLEANAFQLQSLMESYRPTHEKFLQERVDCPMHILTAWEALTKEFDKRAEEDMSLAKFLASEVSVPLYDLVQCKKQINKKSAKDEIELALEHQEEMLNKVQKQYNEVYSKYKAATNKSQPSAPTVYIAQTAILTDLYGFEAQAPNMQHVYNAHNAYVLQLKAMSAWMTTYSNDILPLVCQENEKSNEELTFQLDRIFSREANLLSEQYHSGLKRMQSIHDLGVGNPRPKKPPKSNGGVWKSGGSKERSYEFMKPDACCTLDFMRNDLAFNEETEAVLKRKYYTLIKEANNLEMNIERFKTEMESLNKVRERYLASLVASQGGTSEKLLAKTADELNTDIAQKQVQIREQSCQLSAVREQLVLFKPAEWWPDDAERDLQLSSKTKHILEQKFSMFDHSERSHAFVEYTFKKLTYCDYCRNLLRGIVKQGLKCKYCKMAVHVSCSENASYCTRQPKGKAGGVEEIDPVFNAIRYASTLSSHNRTESISSNGSVGSSSHHNNPSNPHLPLSPHSSSHHTHKRESADLGYRTDSRSPSRFNSGSGGGTGSSSGGGQTMSNSSGASNSLYHHSSTSPNFSTYRDSGSSGSRDRDRDRDQGTSGSGVGAGIGTSQLMVPQGQSGNDGNLTNPDRNFSNESCDSLPKSVSSNGSRSPSPSPRASQISKRGGGLRTQYCLVTRDFLGSKSDDLPIKRGEVVTIVAQDSHDWIRGVCKGLEGYFPESFVIIPGPDDYLMRVTHSYSGNADSVDELSLVKEQIVVYEGEEQPGWCYVKTEFNESGVFPLCYLTKYR
ncbi:uncharacterized protein LOC142339873 isoform X2 [Convolutriloba macropyga]|uniref:uncharacterized protein LOC142339873 isoform X2 n=1 Tax=Convolutriloba macropyga TaxID=536237 RepID=UPI003F524537